MASTLGLEHIDAQGRRDHVVPLSFLEDSSDELKDLECAICLDLLLEPVVGACGHDFCKDCLNTLRDLSLHNGEQSVHCPLCRRPLLLHQDQPLVVCTRLRNLIEARYPEQLRRRKLKALAEASGSTRKRLLSRPPSDSQSLESNTQQAGHATRAAPAPAAPPHSRQQQQLHHHLHRHSHHSPHYQPQQLHPHPRLPAADATVPVLLPQHTPANTPNQGLSTPPRGLAPSVQAATTSGRADRPSVALAAPPPHSDPTQPALPWWLSVAGLSNPATAAALPPGSLAAINAMFSTWPLAAVHPLMSLPAGQGGPQGAQQQQHSPPAGLEDIMDRSSGRQATPGWGSLGTGSSRGHSAAAMAAAAAWHSSIGTSGSGAAGALRPVQVQSSSSSADGEADDEGEEEDDEDEEGEEGEEEEQGGPHEGPGESMWDDEGTEHEEEEEGEQQRGPAEEQGGGAGPLGEQQQRHQQDLHQQLRQQQRDDSWHPEWAAGQSLPPPVLPALPAGMPISQARQGLAPALPATLGPPDQWLAVVQRLVSGVHDAAVRGALPGLQHSTTAANTAAGTGASAALGAQAHQQGSGMRHASSVPHDLDSLGSEAIGAAAADAATAASAAGPARAAGRQARAARSGAARRSRAAAAAAMSAADPYSLSASSIGPAWRSAFAAWSAATASGTGSEAGQAQQQQAALPTPAAAVHAHAPGRVTGGGGAARATAGSPLQLQSQPRVQRAPAGAGRAPDALSAAAANR